LIFVHESHYLSTTEEIGRYRLHENALSNQGYVKMFLEKIAIIHQYCPGINSVLDYGCGPEPVLAELMNRDGLDCDVYDPYFFPELPEKSYDLVISTEVFEHLRNIGAELFTIRSLLLPGGYLAIMTSLHDGVKSFKDWWYINDKTHICFFSMDTFKWIAGEFGFEIVYTNHKNFLILSFSNQRIVNFSHHNPFRDLGEEKC
jgi:SAM-dependent methyltransferase